MDFINKDTEKLIGVVELLLQSSSRINELKNRKYWYPLSRACYGVEEIVESLYSLCSYRTSMWKKHINLKGDLLNFKAVTIQ